MAHLLGVNVHVGGTSAINTKVAALMHARGLKSARFDAFDGDPQTANRDLMSKIIANGGKVQVTLQPSFQFDHSSSAVLSTVETRAYSETTILVNALKDICYDFELLDEIDLRSEILSAVPRDGVNNYLAATYAAGGAPVNALIAALKGMYRAINDIRVASGFPLRILLGFTGRNSGLIKHALNNGVVWDVTVFHGYPLYTEESWVTNPWYGTGGVLTVMAQWGKPCHINAFNSGEIRDPAYANIVGDAKTEEGFQGLAKHLRALRTQTIANIEYVHIYGLVDGPNLR